MTEPGMNDADRSGSPRPLGRERRSHAPPNKAAMRAQLNDDQLDTLRGLERFGWELKFVRRPLFQDPVPVVFDGDTRTCSILRPDGTLEDNPDIDLRRS